MKDLGISPGSAEQPKASRSPSPPHPVSAPRPIYLITGPASFASSSLYSCYFSFSFSSSSPFASASPPSPPPCRLHFLELLPPLCPPPPHPSTCSSPSSLSPASFPISSIFSSAGDSLLFSPIKINPHPKLYLLLFATEDAHTLSLLSLYLTHTHTSFLEPAPSLPPPLPLLSLPLPRVLLSLQDDSKAVC